MNQHGDIGVGGDHGPEERGGGSPQGSTGEVGGVDQLPEQDGSAGRLQGLLEGLEGRELLLEHQQAFLQDARLSSKGLCATREKQCGMGIQN